MKTWKVLALLLGCWGLGILSGCAHENNDNGSGKHVVTMHSSLLLVYLRPTALYYPKNMKADVGPYKKTLAALPIRQATLDALHSVGNEVPWLTGIRVGHYLNKGKGGIDLHEYWRVSHDSDYDGVVSVQPTLELTPGLKKVLLVVIIWVQKDTPVTPVRLATKVITETITLGKAGAPLSREELQGINAENPALAGRARARIWFAARGHRLDNAVLFDLNVMTQNLRTFLLRRQWQSR